MNCDAPVTVPWVLANLKTNNALEGTSSSEYIPSPYYLGSIQKMNRAKLILDWNGDGDVANGGKIYCVKYSVRATVTLLTPESGASVDLANGASNVSPMMVASCPYALTRTSTGDLQMHTSTDGSDFSTNSDESSIGVYPNIINNQNGNGTYIKMYDAISGANNAQKLMAWTFGLGLDGIFFSKHSSSGNSAVYKGGDIFAWNEAVRNRIAYRLTNTADTFTTGGDNNIYVTKYY
jgi:hypothetical protein